MNTRLTAVHRPPDLPKSAKAGVKSGPLEITLESTIRDGNLFWFICMTHTKKKTHHRSDEPNSRGSSDPLTQRPNKVSMKRMCVNFKPSGALKVTCWKWQEHYIIIFWFTSAYWTGVKSHSACSEGPSERRCGGGRTEERNAGECDSCGGRRGEQIQLLVLWLSQEFLSFSFIQRSFTFSNWENETLRPSGTAVHQSGYSFWRGGGGACTLTAANDDIIAKWF